MHQTVEDFFGLPHGENTSSKRLVEKFKAYNTSLGILIYFNTAAKTRGGCVVETGIATLSRFDLAAA